MSAFFFFFLKVLECRDRDVRYSAADCFLFARFFLETQGIELKLFLIGITELGYTISHVTPYISRSIVSICYILLFNAFVSQYKLQLRVEYLVARLFLREIISRVNISHINAGKGVMILFPISLSLIIRVWSI